MNTSMLSLQSSRWLLPGISARTALLALVLLAGVMPATAHAQRFAGRHGFGPSFGRGLGWGLGLGIGSALVYDSVGYYSPPVVYTAESPTIYYVPQPTPQTIVVNSTPAPAAAVMAPAAPTPLPVESSAGKLSKIVYDSAGKPAGVIVMNPDGKQEFIPLAQ